MSPLQRLRLAFESDLGQARKHRESAIMQMNVADAEIKAATDAIDRIDREVAREKEPKK